MKRVLLAVAMVLGMLGVANAEVTKTPTKAAVSDAQCKYKLADAVAGLKGFKVVGFEPKAQSPDGNRVFGVLFFHNPKAAKADSIDAMALVLVDKAADKQLTFLVAYLGAEKATVYKREKSKDGKGVGPCFEKTLEDMPKETSK